MRRRMETRRGYVDRKISSNAAEESLRESGEDVAMDGSDFITGSITPSSTIWFPLLCKEYEHVGAFVTAATTGIDGNSYSTYNGAAREYVQLTMKKTNITLKLDSDLLRQVKIRAAQKGTSISAILTAQLEDFVSKDEEYEAAMTRAILLMNESKGSGWQKPKSRDALHER